eukprot:TRINITY_DN1578_c0_g1_i4.p1 TRINITY_DN1578_c0_g1~~TRINITY_DN1578_c0_g1_i4.p1  ORF type:complete len:495 (+),score=106.85 TRINITY_DN1578_c0_g1_i4:308-1792(+)
MSASRLRPHKFLRPFYGYYVGSKEVAHPDVRLKVHDKYTEEVATEVGLASKATINNAIEHAVKSTRAMKDLPYFKRKEILLEVASRLQSGQKEFAEAITIEVGKPISDSTVEVGRAIDTFTLAAEEAVRIHGNYIPLDVSQRNAGITAITKRFPIGPIAMISPFNFPLNLVAHKVAPAIAAGCPFVLKPSDRTPVSALLLGEILSKTALPQGAFSILPTSLEDASILSKDERFKVISFTGSPGVGWKIKNDAGKKRVVLELGGNAGCIVDGNLSEERLNHASKRILFGAFYSAGQSCISVQRVYAHESIYDALKSKLVQGAADLNKRKGDPMDPNTFLGPLISEGDAKRVEEWVHEAVQSGAKVLVGGKRDGKFYDITIVENAPDSCKLKHKEVFAPVCTIEKFTDFKKVIDQVNDSQFGLQAGIFTDKIDNAFYGFQHLDVGGVVINDVPSLRVDSQPYGGIKDSGFGREGITYSIEEFSEIKTLLMKDIGNL